MYARNLNIILLSFILSFYGCQSSVDKNKEHNTETANNLIVENKQCNPKNQSGYLGEINATSIGIVEIDREFPNLEDYIGYESQNVEQIVPDANSKQLVTHLYYNGNEICYVEFKKNQLIKTLVTYNPNFYLSNCLHVGSSVSDLKNKYQLLDVMLNNDDGMLFIQPIDNPTIRFMIGADNIINNNKVNQADGKTSIDNINPRGLIISIMVSN